MKKKWRHDVARDVAIRRPWWEEHRMCHAVKVNMNIINFYQRFKEICSLLQPVIARRHPNLMLERYVYYKRWPSIHLLMSSDCKCKLYSNYWLYEIMWPSLSQVQHLYLSEWQDVHINGLWGLLPDCHTSVHIQSIYYYLCTQVCVIVTCQF